MEKSKLKKHSNVTEYFIEFLNGTTSNRPKLVRPNIYKRWKKENKEQRELKILKVRLTLLKLLYQIIHYQKILDSKELQYFIKVCDEYIVKYKVKNGKVKKVFELAPSSKFKEYVYPPWLRDLSFNIIDYLSDSNNDIRKIKQCEWCRDFFISAKADKRTKYCPLCSPKNKMSKEQRKNYQRGRRATEKNEKDNFIKNEYITRLINAGCSREEAERTFKVSVKPEL